MYVMTWYGNEKQEKKKWMWLRDQLVGMVDPEERQKLVRYLTKYLIYLTGEMICTNLTFDLDIIVSIHYSFQHIVGNYFDAVEFRKRCIFGVY